MHHDCPDFDLCGVCEAHPIALHPKSHPLLKMKTPEIMVPNFRTRETTFSSNPRREAQPEDVNKRSQLAPVPPEPSSPFIWGYMHASTLSNDTGLRTPVVKPTLIPRLDEISPSLIRVPLEEVSRASPIEDADRDGTRPVPVPHGTEKVEDERENRIDITCLPKCLESETTWPATAAELAHLMPLVEPSSHCNMSIQHQHGFQSSPEISPTPSPLTGDEALLSAPVEEPLSDMQQKSAPPVTVSRQTLAMLLGEQDESLSKIELFSIAPVEEAQINLSSSKVSPTKVERHQNVEEQDGAALNLENEKQLALKKSITELEDKVYLSAMFVEDVTVSDGQVFPPGAEFMKCWRMLNDSENDWPETTELVYVAGEILGMQRDVAVSVGLVKSGSEIELWTGELKVRTTLARAAKYPYFLGA